MVMSFTFNVNVSAQLNTKYRNLHQNTFKIQQWTRERGDNPSKIEDSLRRAFTFQKYQPYRVKDQRPILSSK